MLVFNAGLARFSSLPVALLAFVFAACADDAASTVDLGPDVTSSNDSMRPRDLATSDIAQSDAAGDLGIVLREAGGDSSVDTRFVCNPSAPGGSFYALSASTGFREVSMCEYRDRVLLVVNIAAK